MNDARANGKRSNRIYTGYHQKPDAGPDTYLTQTGRGTPGGEYLRLFWHPVAYLSELGDYPLRARALGEDLVVFRNKSGEVGVMHLNCCHRNTSLEYGVIEENGIRCCYHGRLFAVDGTILEMPGEPESLLRNGKLRQGAYPVHIFGGIVFTYMGPPEKMPVFPQYDRLDLPGMKLVPGNRWALNCNWLQIQENTVDPAHTATLHAIPQLRGMDHFAAEFGNFPDLITWAQTPAGYMYMAARLIEDRIWVRSAEAIGPTMRCISSIFEEGQAPKRASLPFITFWILPIDDEHTCNFFVSHVAPDEKMPFEKRRQLEAFGQTNDRSYTERQFIPGDHEAQTGQGAINNHGAENLATMDRGITLFRRYLRRNIELAERGGTPHGVYYSQDEVPPTMANDFVASLSSLQSFEASANGLEVFCGRLVEQYTAAPPMNVFRQVAPKPA